GDVQRQRYAADMALSFQLTTFLQDLSLDLQRGRLYIPQEDLEHFDLKCEALQALLGAREDSPSTRDAATVRSFRELLRFQTARARSFYERGRPLLGRIENDLGIELSLTFQSGLALLDKIDALGDGLLRTRPTLGKAERARVAARALGTRMPRILRRPKPREARCRSTLSTNRGWVNAPSVQSRRLTLITTQSSRPIAVARPPRRPPPNSTASCSMSSHCASESGSARPAGFARERILRPSISSPPR
ncbi:MAG: squalene/phytoene synthase family protein, partial [Bryobacterales bacterium]|nr:squalene/phytoene synthase family protein [Bryobacterales bacterium]